MNRSANLEKVLSRPGARIIEDAAFTMVQMPATARLAGLVNHFTLYREHSPAPIVQKETASFTIPFLIGFSDPFDIALGREPNADDRYVSFTSGLCMAPVEIRSRGNSTCLDISFTPPGARAFFARPMSELTERMVPLDDLEDRELIRFRETVGNEGDWGRRLLMAEALAEGRLAAADVQPFSPVSRAFEVILERGGDIEIGRLASRIGWSRKHLAHRFHDEIGMPPKSVARLARFTSAQALARDGCSRSWADIAAACGYADQAHLSREFRELAGSTPAAWLADAH
jgi:AraC-like DNA-binding protein